jgi:PAS domain S-box-containing protein
MPGPRGTPAFAGDAAMPDSEVRFRIVLSNSPMIVATCDAELRYTWIFNPASPFTPESVLGRRDDEISDPADVADLVALKLEALQYRERIRREVAVRLDGETRWYDVTAEPLLDDDGAAVGVTTAAADVTARRRAEEERISLLASERRSREAAEKAIRDRDAVLRVVSHDLRTPLNSIRMAADLLLASPGAPPERRAQRLEVIRHTTTQMERLVQVLLDQQRIDEGAGLPVVPRPVELRPVLDEVLALFDLPARAHEVELAIDVASDLPSMWADRERLLQVLWNLVDNGLQHTPAGGRITLSAHADGGAICCGVHDTGPGIPPEHAPRIFEPFWQAGPAERGGAGLGLPICRAIVEAHGGTIRVESTVGSGSSFEFRIPSAPDRS